jgi:hypothetical protein
MYKPKDRDTYVLFPELFPFGGRLDERNRWLRISELIPWPELEGEYLKYFSSVGRPAKDAQLILGLLLLKHMTKLSDREMLVTVMKNPYMQAFCGFHSMAAAATLDASTLTQVRKRLGPKFFRELEKKTYTVLIERGIIRARRMLADATVFPEEIKFPTDVGLLSTTFDAGRSGRSRRWGGSSERAGGRPRRSSCRFPRPNGKPGRSSARPRSRCCNMDDGTSTNWCNSSRKSRISKKSAGILGRLEGDLPPAGGDV